MIEDGDNRWLEHVPPEVAEAIQRRGFFGYKRPKPSTKDIPSKPIIPLGDSYNVYPTAQV